MLHMLLVIDTGLRFVMWLLPGLILIVVILLAFSWADRRRESRNKENELDRRNDKNGQSEH